MKPITLTIAKRNRAKWVKALRSGKWKQAIEALHAPYYRSDDDRYEQKASGEKHCCLGVASRVCKMPDAYEYDGELTTSGLCVLGLTKTQADILIRANDYKEKDFKQIADIIDAMPVYEKALKQ